MSDEFKVLSDVEHALIRPQMYIGSTSPEEVSGIIGFKYQTKTIVPGLLKIIFEIFDNSIDEFIRTNGEFANKISIDVSNAIDGWSVSIVDNGRGIPVEKIGDSYRPVVAWTSLRAGSNFGEDRVSIGANGVGSSLTNIFSKHFIGQTSDGKNSITVTCSENMSKVSYDIRASKSKGTSVTFIPDLERFGVDSISDDHLEMIKDRMLNMAIVYPGLSLKFNGELIKFKSLKEVGELFSEKYIIASSASDGVKVDMIIAPSGNDEEFRCLSYVNGLNIKNGGSHVDCAMNRIIDTLRTVIKKKHKFDVVPNQIKQHILFASWISGFKNLKFDSQTKERVTNTQGEVSGVFDGIEFDKIAKKILDTPEIIDPIISALIRKQEALEAAELKRLNKDSEKSNLRKIVKFTDATEKVNREDCMLMLCEGDSANNSLLSARTALIGCYPLRGKPLNAFAASVKDLMANSEFTEFLAISGLKIGQKVTSHNDVRFGKFVWVTDSDPDGNAIAGLLCGWIRKFWPELFELGMIYRFQTPIMKAIIGKDEKYFNTVSEFEDWAKLQKKSFKTRYLKGLGSSTASDFRKYFADMEQNLIQLTVDSVEDFDVVDMLYTKDAGASDKRKIWLEIE